jgi:hypothetical protein
MLQKPTPPESETSKLIYLRLQQVRAAFGGDRTAVQVIGKAASYIMIALYDANELVLVQEKGV